jgi:hypothetical protein
MSWAGRCGQPSDEGKENTMDEREILLQILYEIQGIRADFQGWSHKASTEAQAAKSEAELRLNSLMGMFTGMMPKPKQ